MAVYYSSYDPYHHYCHLCDLKSHTLPPSSPRSSRPPLSYLLVSLQRPNLWSVYPNPSCLRRLSSFPPLPELLCLPLFLL